MTAIGHPWFDMCVIWVSIGLSAIAACASMLAARHALPEMRATFAAAGLLASIYCGSYLWLAFNLEDAAEWSSLMRPVGMVSWLVAWTAPPVISMRLWTKLQRKAHANVHPISGSVGDATERYRKGA